ncbi:hypothetical protein ENSA5_14280 [Enhygromyxa salina]|uniref:Mechanosensitive ion channel MscS domain-containing protein n=1 Tax=Enhygromyxa salina TaxID=215803 RepID=A0A2S9YER1_9BACT|nr:mechanosensitive ion channel domain-containing protein [Enhygromyxa salina]PRQ03593.1 hypothetical protein ENSA5_14280 [Enhygromyxa salina]
MTMMTMMMMTPLEEIALEPVESLWAATVEHAPSILSATLLLLVMWLVARLVRALVAKLLGMTKLDEAAGRTRLSTILAALDADLTMSKAIAALAHFAILLLAFMSAADLLGLETVSTTLGTALAFVPRLVSALLVIGVGGYIASAARRTVGAALRGMRSPYAGPLEAVTEVALLVVVIAISIDVLGVDVSFITSNITMLIAIVLATLAFLLAWSMRKPAEEIIANYYLRRLLRAGDLVDLGGIEGTVESFTALGVLVRDARGHERFVPARHVLDGLRRSGRERVNTAA